MSIKAGAILFDANGYVIDRIQTGGPGSLNIPEEKVYEVGNWQSVGTVYDIPDLSFDLESFDVSPEFEFILVNDDPLDPVSTQIDFQNAAPIDILSPFKSTRNAYNIINGVIVPYLTLERVSYSFGVGSNASQSFTLRGDSIYYTPGQPMMQRIAATADDAPLPVVYSNGPAIVYKGSGSDEFLLNFTAYKNVGGQTIYKRYYEEDMASVSNAGFTIPASINSEDNEWDYYQICYAGPKEYIDYDQSVHAIAAEYTDPDEAGPLGVGSLYSTPGATPFAPGTKPAAVRAKDIDVYYGAQGADPEVGGTWTRLTGVQNFEATWSVSLENDEELGNSRYVDQDYDVPEVSGSMTVKAFDTADLFHKISTVTGVNPAEVLGPNITDPIQVKVEINDPASPGTIIKTIHLPEARFTVPGFSGQVQTKLENQFDWTSDTGDMKVYKGAINIP